MTIRKKLITMQLSTALAVIVLGSAVFVFNEIQLFRTALVNGMSSTAMLIGENSASTLVFLDDQSAERVLASLQVEPHIANACIYDGEGSAFATYARKGNETFVFPRASDSTHVFRDGFLELFQPISRGQKQIGTVFLRSDLTELGQKIDEYIRDAAVVLAIGMALSLFLAFVLQRAISRPVLDLVTATRSVSDTGDYSQRVVQRSKDELGVLAAALNEMLELIQKRDASLLEARDTLEVRVEERTLELQEAKDRLEQSLTAEQDARTAAEEARGIAEEANRTKSIFLANMSHEIRTPLNAVLGYAQILGSEPGLSDAQRKAIETIDLSGRQLLRLINDILDISKIEAGRETLNPVDFDLRSLVQDLGTALEVQCQQKGLRWELEEDLPVWHVHGDENKLRQVMTNLLGNAVKFTEAGRVMLRVEMRREGMYLFEVTDTGPGIAPEGQKAIFEPFQQEMAGVHHGGTGLGLSIARRQVDLMGGRLGLDSATGKGARFSFTLSLPPARGFESADTDVHSEQEYSAVQRLSDGHVVHALIVDDVATNRDILAQMLDRIGAEVETAESGEEALEQVRQRRPDIVFMDIRMPGGMDGAETTQHLIAEHGRDAMKVVAVTASVFQHQRQRFAAVGFDRFIDKPLRQERIYACLADLLGVGFEHADVEPVGDAADSTVGWQDLALPSELHAGLVAAVDTHSITELRKHVDSLEELGEDGRRLALHLRKLSGRYDMEAVKRVLEEVDVH